MMTVSRFYPLFIGGFHDNDTVKSVMIKYDQKLAHSKNNTKDIIKMEGFQRMDRRTSKNSSKYPSYLLCF
jgi:hypothetical protein